MNRIPALPIFTSLLLACQPTPSSEATPEPPPAAAQPASPAPTDAPTDAPTAPADTPPEAPPMPNSPTDAQPIPDAWLFEGELSPITDLGLPFTLSLGEDTGLLTVPAQGLKDAVLSDVTRTDSHIHFEWTPPGAPKEIRAVFDATREGDVYTGTLNQGDATMNFTLTRVERFHQADRPQMPTPPFPYTAEDRFIQADDARLACTLTLPPGGGAHPAIAFFPGSGPLNRDQELFEHKPLLVWSDAFTRQGFATLRCDKRGAGESTRGARPADLDALKADAEAVISYLKNHPRTQGQRIGALGHSEGGMLVAHLASKGELDFAVSLAAPALSGDEVLLSQQVHFLEKSGASAATLKAYRQVKAAFYTWLKGEADPAEEDAEVAKVVALLKDHDLSALGSPVTLTQSLKSEAGNPWIRTFIRDNPADSWRQSHIPMLILFGEKDIQVPAQAHYDALKALPNAANIDTAIIPNANHLFQTATTGEITEYTEISETIMPSVMDRVLTWAKEKTTP